MKINVGVSNRHAHLTEETFVKLFGHNKITKRNDLNQIGEFASDFTVDLKTEKGTLERVRILGPFRDYDQVEISVTDSYKLGIKPPVRASGDVKDSASGTLIGEIGEVKLDTGIIIAERHIHMTEKQALEFGFVDKQAVVIKIEGIKRGVIEAFVKISSKAFLEIHLDTDDANAFLLKNGDEVEMILNK